eukprot:CAMPEP_0173456466 /NCGR_PEP_ID=MMETSP1357-20121228/56072_1 /TAXON_ID=77926 /ORGANISM="Hemiselmis rufescens, Strain PCC563" /LENGTH=218 /DNA_ID=CAMNT_0014423691 /DNA_START=63 /DNA_END=718 /DNA_ORIENTATION=+
MFDKRVFFIPPWEMMLVGFFMLNFIYIKFLTIWRVSASLALTDGIQAPENMRRCVNNNYTFSGFWRSWHSSLHAWIVRYVYIPLGGRSTQLLTVGPIFLFVGAWHDLETRWLAWGSLNCVFFCAESLLLSTLRSSKLVEGLRGALWWRYLCAACAVCNILWLMLSNLAILYGFQGSADYVRAIWDPPSAYVGGGGGASVHGSGLLAAVLWGPGHVLDT